MARSHPETHLLERISWLRASVLGANDGIVSTSSLVLGVAAAGADSATMLLTGTAGLVAGAMSMAAGEYVSVSSQADAEAADIAKEKAELADSPAAERAELVAIYQKRGLDRALAEQVTDQLMEKDALKAHLRDELGLTDEMAARPIQAAWASALAFSIGAALPLSAAYLAPRASVDAWIAGGSLLFLALLGGVGAKMGGAPVGKAVLRVTFWGAFAMAATAAIGSLFGANVA
jgi:VIT1/CCC1 family predicted Fe2+/Mn2+ transporter